MSRPSRIVLLSSAFVTLMPTAARAAEPNQAAVSASPALDSDDARLRMGFDTSAGPLFGTGGAGTTFALRLRAGVQAGRYVALAIQSTTFFIADEGRVLSSGVGVLLEHAAMLHVTPVNALDLGIGAAVDVGTPRGSAGSGTDESRDRLMFALTARVAANIGRTNPATGKRVAFTFGVCPHLVFAPAGAVLVLTAGPGAEWF